MRPLIRLPSGFLAVLLVSLMLAASSTLSSTFSDSTATQPTALAQAQQPLIIAHRGASGYLPENTLAAFSLAILQGADFIELDLVATQDHHLIARHENRLDLTTDVADHPEFQDRKTTKTIDGTTRTGWFSEDFTLAEIKRLRARERFDSLRAANTRFDGTFTVPTLQEVIDLVKALEPIVGRRIGLYPETKHPTYFADLGLPLEPPLVEILHDNDYREPTAPVFIQSFEINNLKTLRTLTRLPLAQLIGRPNTQPYDVEAADGTRTYGDMATAEGLREIATYAQGVGPEKSHVIPRTLLGRLSQDSTTTFVANAQKAGLKVHPYTLRAENHYLPRNLRRGLRGSRIGQAEAEVRMFLEAGVDGLFIDHPDIGVRARANFLNP
jgi:glycerophosphoryl diester phosphodiesterase